MARVALKQRRSAPFGRILVALALVGCAPVAWENIGEADAVAIAAPAGSLGDAALSALPSALRGGDAEKVQGMEVIVGIINNSILGSPTAHYLDTPIKWSDAHSAGSGLEAAFVFKRPQRGASSLAVGDSFVMVKFTRESFGGREFQDDFAGITASSFGGFSVMSFWLDGRTVLDPFTPRGGARPYLQYGGGIVSWPSVTRNFTAGTIQESNIQGGLKLGWHSGVGVEWRKGSFGIYAEYGIQIMDAPEIGTTAAEDQMATRSLITTPIRFGATLAF